MYIYEYKYFQMYMYEYVYVIFKARRGRNPGTISISPIIDGEHVYIDVYIR
jgi:hypothetical protein